MANPSFNNPYPERCAIVAEIKVSANRQDTPEIRLEYAAWL